MVFAVPGSTGRKADFAQVGPALARRGVVVFATDFRADSSDEELTRSLECGYRYGRVIAGDYGGDLRQPVTMVGYSRGARAIWSALDERRYGHRGSFRGCFEGAPRPDVVAAIDGCYYGWGGRTYTFPPGRLDVGEGKLVLISGAADDVCPTWQSSRAAHALKDAGYDATLVTIPNATHHAVVHGWGAPTADSAGEATVKAILDAIHEAR